MAIVAGLIIKQINIISCGASFSSEIASSINVSQNKQHPPPFQWDSICGLVWHVGSCALQPLVIVSGSGREETTCRRD